MRQNWQLKCLWGELGLDQSGGGWKLGGARRGKTRSGEECRFGLIFEVNQILQLHLYVAGEIYYFN